MNNQVIYLINHNYYLKRFLREHSYYYKDIIRNPNFINEIINKMKITYKMTLEDKIDKIENDISLINSVMNILK